jgi:glycosyltransferase involved in cell wall biosynthesis
LKIMHLSQNLLDGGLETHILDLCREHIKNGDTPYLFGMLVSDTFREQLESLGIQYLNDKSPDTKLRDFILEHDIQVLHCHPYKTIALGAKLGAALKKPVVVTYHGYWGWDLQAHHKVQKIITVSQEIFDKISKADPAIVYKMTVIQNGIDTIGFKPSGIPGNGSKILYIGRLVREKYNSLKVIIKALQPLPGIQLLVAGDGPYSAQLSSKAPNWVNFLGFVKEMPTLINRVDIVIGTGRGIREAMACGKPAISMDDLGYDGIVTPDNIRTFEYYNFMGRSGTPLNKDILLRDVQMLIDSQEARAELGNWGRNYVEEHYSVSGFFARHKKIYEEVTRGNPLVT